VGHPCPTDLPDSVHRVDPASRQENNGDYQANDKCFHKYLPQYLPVNPRRLTHPPCQTEGQLGCETYQ